MRWVKVMVIVVIAGFALVGMLGTVGVGVASKLRYSS